MVSSAPVQITTSRYFPCKSALPPSRFIIFSLFWYVIHPCRFAFQYTASHDSDFHPPPAQFPHACNRAPKAPLLTCSLSPESVLSPSILPISGFRSPLPARQCCVIGPSVRPATVFHRSVGFTPYPSTFLSPVCAAAFLSPTFFHPPYTGFHPSLVFAMRVLLLNVILYCHL